jgi:hypothetical protein
MATSKKLWAFGCSYTAGFELGTGMTKHEIHKWVKQQTKYDSHQEAAEFLSYDEYLTKVVRPWHKLIEYKSTPELAYSGILARMKNLNLVNCAIPGISTIEIFEKFMSKIEEIDWDNDTVIVAPTYYGRWPTQNNQTFNVHMLDRKTLDSYYEMVPSNNSQIINYYSLLFFIQQNYPKVMLVKIYDSDPYLDMHTTINFVNEISLNSYIEDESFKLPGYHYNEEAHEKFAYYIIDKI